jgi:hypothetical protein
LWEQLADENAAPKRAEVISRALERCLFGERHYGSEESVLTRKKAMEKLEPRLVAGQPWQRIVALSLLLPRSVEETVIQAEKLVANEALPERIRCLAFQMQLLASGEADRRTLSIAAISSNDTCRQRLALACLTDGAQSMQYAGELGYLYVSRTSEVHFSSSDDSKVIVPEAPKGLQLQHVAPLLAQGDGETKARAGYLLALLGEAEGLKPLLDYWKSDKGADEAVARLVYRAVAALDDESQLAVLKQIYATLKDGYEIREFYWTVRGMSGKSILEFRGQMRKELGMERLN